MQGPKIDLGLLVWGYIDLDRRIQDWDWGQEFLDLGMTMEE
jgi:hypothetical protein